MRQIILFLFICLVASTTVQAQETTESLLVKSNWRINILPLNVGYEHQVGPKSTIYARAGLNWNLYDADTTVDFDFGTLLPSLQIDGQYRHFYNMEKRQAKGKSIFMNSGNFIGGQMSIITEPFNYDSSVDVGENNSSLVIGPVWGIQRNKDNRFSFVFSIGPALEITGAGVDTILTGQLSLGVLLGDMGQ